MVCWLLSSWLSCRPRDLPITSYSGSFKDNKFCTEVNMASCFLLKALIFLLIRAPPTLRTFIYFFILFNVRFKTKCIFWILHNEIISCFLFSKMNWQTTIFGNLSILVVMCVLMSVGFFCGSQKAFKICSQTCSCCSEWWKTNFTLTFWKYVKK